MAVFEERDRGELQSLAARLAEHEGTIALLAAAGDKAHLVFARNDALPQDMNVTLQAAFARLNGGRGGGRPSLAQGGGIPATSKQLTAVLNDLVSEL
jgi:alanyl-tRNA synthetase